MLQNTIFIFFFFFFLLRDIVVPDSPPQTAFSVFSMIQKYLFHDSKSLLLFKVFIYESKKEAISKSETLLNDIIKAKKRRNFTATTKKIDSSI